MSCFQVIVQDGRKLCRPVTSRETYLSLRNSEANVENRVMAELGNEDAKKNLVQMNYSCIPNADGTLKGATQASTTVAIDIDHVLHNMMQPLRELILSKKDELGLLMCERSARGEGYHLVFRRRPDLSQEDNLRWASDLLGVEYDKGAKDITRVFFTTTASEEDLIYLDDELFKVEEAKEEVIRKTEEVPLASNILPLTSPLLPPNQQALAAFDLCVKKAGLKPEEMDVWGEHNWHNNLMAVLSVGVAKLMSRDQLEAVIRERLPNYSQTEDCKKLVNYFYENYSADKGFMNTSLREINAQAQEQGGASDMEKLTVGWNPPQMPTKLPRLIQLLIKPFPEQYHPMLVVTACVVLGAIASHFRSTYIDGRVIAPNLYAALIAGSAKGKNWVSILFELMCRHTLQTWDDAEWAKVRENQELRDKMSNAKDKPAKYHPRFRIMETMSKTSLLEVQTNLGENGMVLCNYNESDELANASRLQFSNISVLLRKAWDLDKHRQFYMSESSCNTQTRLNAAILLTGTPRSVLTRLFSDTENGMMQRFIPMIMPTLKRTFRPPKFMPLTPDDEAERDGLLASLWQKDLALGDGILMVELPKTQKMILDWYDALEERYSDGLLTEAEADLSHRIGQHMQRAAIPFFALNGEERKEVIDLVRWIGDFAYYNICHIFSSRVTEDMKESEQMLRARIDNRNTAEPLLNFMPETFTIHQLREERLRQGQTGDVRMLLSRWCKKGKLQRLEKGVYRKLMKVR